MNNRIRIHLGRIGLEEDSYLEIPLRAYTFSLLDLKEVILKNAWVNGDSAIIKITVLRIPKDVELPNSI